MTNFPSIDKNDEQVLFEVDGVMEAMAAGQFEFSDAVETAVGDDESFSIAMNLSINMNDSLGFGLGLESWFNEGGPLSDISFSSDMEPSIVDKDDVGNLSICKEPSPARKTKYNEFFERLDIDISPKVWWHFVKLCERSIPSSQIPSHFTFWNQMAACFYCTTIAHSLPISRWNIIEIHVDITVIRFQKALKPIMNGEKELSKSLTDEHVANFILRLVEANNVYFKNPQFIFSRVQLMRDEKFNFNLEGLSNSFLIICIFSSFMQLKCDKELRAACLFFGVEKTEWLEEKCTSIKNRFS